MCAQSHLWHRCYGSGSGVKAQFSSKQSLKGHPCYASPSQCCNHWPSPNYIPSPFWAQIITWELNTFFIWREISVISLQGAWQALGSISAAIYRCVRCITQRWMNHRKAFDSCYPVSFILVPTFVTQTDLTVNWVMTPSSTEYSRSFGGSNYLQVHGLRVSQTWKWQTGVSSDEFYLAYSPTMKMGTIYTPEIRAIC